MTDPSDVAVYLVQTVSEPLAVNEATRPAAGDKINTGTSSAQQWLSRLVDEHDSVLEAVGVDAARKVYDYGVVFNGFAARLTEAEAARMKSTSGVVRVWRDEVRHESTITTPDFLSLTGEQGVWQQQFQGPTRAGEGVIIGVIDTGFWPEHPSFAPLPEPRPDADVIAAKWRGSCDTGEPSDPGAAITCNNKVIGARFFKDGMPKIEDFEFLSPRDHRGHGSHTASTAAGNVGVPAIINGLAVGTTSGMAPAARLAIYKAIWQQPSGGGTGMNSDLVAAINQAVADGVDVISYSNTGSTGSVVLPDEIAFMNAAAAGVFVATTAANGSSLGTVQHNSPWTTTVASSTHGRIFAKTVTLGNGTSHAGLGVSPGAVASSPLVNSTAIGKPGADPNQVRMCFGGALDPALAVGKIIVCDRGGVPNVDKSKAVKEAGGVGMILTNTGDAQSVDADFHFVPTIHVSRSAGAAIKAYAGAAGATAAFSVTDHGPATAPEMASSSSQGPAVAGGGDLLKPDITAPGVDVIAAAAPPNSGGNLFSTRSGTSMSTPHIAGIAALIKSKHPDWSPMAIKSAIMTTATTRNNAGDPIRRGTVAATPLNYGAGHVVPASAFDPGLVYDSGRAEWLQYACGIGQLQAAECEAFGSIDPSDLNYPSIAVGDLAGSQTITRTVTNVTDSVGEYDVHVEAPAGFTVAVSSQTLVVQPGQRASFRVTITRTDAPIGQWAFGTLRLEHVGAAGHTVTSPIAVRPALIAAPSEIRAGGISGSAVQQVTSGFTGTLSTKVSGPSASTVTELGFTGTDWGFDPSAPAESPGAKKVTVTVPAGSVMAKFATFDDDAPAGSDVDLYVYVADTTQSVGRSTNGTAEEAVTVATAGTYDIYVVFYGRSGGAVTTINHHAFIVPAAPAGNLAVSPASQAVTTGSAVPITLQWTGLTAGRRYLGLLSYSDGTTTLARTTISIVG